jgi:hypothetical protein
MAGSIKTRSVWEAAILTYLGYPLLAIDEGGGVEFTVACPEAEFQDLKSTYYGGSLGLTSAHAFVRAYNDIINRRHKMKDMGQQHWVSSEWVAGVGV